MEPPVNPAAFHALFHCWPSTGLSAPMHVIASARPLLSAVRSAAVLAVLFALAAFHNDFKARHGGGDAAGAGGGPPEGRQKPGGGGGRGFFFTPCRAPFFFALGR